MARRVARWLGFAAALALLGGCTQGPTTATSSPAPTASVPTALPSPSPSPTAAALPCRMPASLRVDQGGNREVLGFLSLPAGTTVDDTSDAIVKVADFPVSSGVTVPVWGTVTSPQLFGAPLGTYSPSAARWLPAPPEVVAPDGHHYVYVHPNGSLRLAGADGSELPVSNPNNLTPLSFTSSGVILVQSGPASNGLWLLDSTTQSVSVITPPAGADDWREVTGTIAFGVNSPGVLGAAAPTAVLSAAIDAAAAPKTIYTAGAGSSIAFIAADRLGGVLIGVTGSAPGLVYLNGGVGPVAVAVPSGAVIATIGPRHHADAHGIWFLGRTGIFLFTPPSTFQQIAAGTTTDVAPGGDCT